MQNLKDLTISQEDVYSLRLLLSTIILKEQIHQLNLSLRKNLKELKASYEEPFPNTIQEGSACTFIRINETFGAKFYHAEYERDFAFKRQTTAHKHGFGPKPGERFQTYAYGLYGNGIKEWFGYYTEVADTKVRKHKTIQEDFKTLRALMKKHRFQTFDLDIENDGNIGYINNRLVCIDFCLGTS